MSSESPSSVKQSLRSSTPSLASGFVVSLPSHQPGRWAEAPSSEHQTRVLAVPRMQPSSRRAQEGVTGLSDTASGKPQGTYPSYCSTSSIDFSFQQFEHAPGFFFQAEELNPSRGYLLVAAAPQAQHWLPSAVQCTQNGLGWKGP